jgi:hypothetical protein
MRDRDAALDSAIPEVAAILRIPGDADQHSGLMMIAIPR